MISLAIIFIGYSYIKMEIKMNNIDKSDSEFSVLWNNFLQNDIKTHQKLSKNTYYYILLASHIATQSQGQYRILIEQALKDGIFPWEIKEVIYQTIPYVGYAKAYDFLVISNQYINQNDFDTDNIKLATTDPSNRLEKGLEIQRKIFGTQQIDSMRQKAPQDLKHIQDYLSANCFGDYYTRKGIDVPNRELITFSALVSLGGTDEQVKAHAQANLNVGNNRAVLIDVLTQLLPYIGYPRTLNAISAVNAVTN